MINTLNMILNMILVLSSCWAILSDRVRDGIIIKAGLSLTNLGFLGGLFLDIEGRDSVSAMEGVLTLIQLGLCVILVGYLLRLRVSHSMHRRTTDFISKKR